jgi:hypothetical protein
MQATDEATSAPVPAHAGGGQYDHARRRQSKRSGRQRGCWVYIPGEELAKTGHGHPDPAPAYRVWGNDRGRVVIQLYKET